MILTYKFTLKNCKFSYNGAVSVSLDDYLYIVNLWYIKLPSKSDIHERGTEFINIYFFEDITALIGTCVRYPSISGYVLHQKIKTVFFDVPTAHVYKRMYRYQRLRPLVESHVFIRGDIASYNTDPP